MTAYAPPLADIRFVLEHIARLPDLVALPGLGHASPDVVDAVLEEAGRLAGDVWAPTNWIGDQEGSILENGVVRTPASFKPAYRAFAEGGWMGVTSPERWGGQALPWTVGTAVAELWSAANMTLQLCPLLAQAAIEALIHHGSRAQQALYLPKLVSGTWTAAMCLTEPQAGTDVGAVRTRAVPDGNDFRICGQKIFITFGDHDLAENVAHFVLARLPGAPEGTRGISLFIVPKLLPDADGRPGRRNDLRVLKLEHKLGIKASPTCVMAYGEDEGAIGELVGEPHGGIRLMFTMMNNARLAVGHQGLGIAERAYQQALAYAKERVQGRLDGRPARIIEFPDVRRMLLTMRAQIAAMRALCLWTAGFVDRSYSEPDATRRRLAADRVALLTPVVKAWSTDLAQTIACDAVQVHGGMGFIEETGPAQHMRDAKILAIYEGTNGIQALDLAARKLGLDGGAAVAALLGELRGEAPADPALAAGLAAALAALERTTRHLQSADATARAAGATPYLRLMGWTLGAFLLARGARAAEGCTDGAAWPGLARFYVTQLLPPAIALADAVEAPPGQLDPTLLVA